MRSRHAEASLDAEDVRKILSTARPRDCSLAAKRWPSVCFGVQAATGTMRI